MVDEKDIQAKEINGEKNTNGQSTEKVADFKSTSTAAKLSGSFHKTSGFIKRKWGEFIDDADLKRDGRKQELIGRVHKLVGLVRESREDFIETIESKKSDCKKVALKHGSKLIDGTTEFIKDLKSILFK